MTVIIREVEMTSKLIHMLFEEAMDDTELYNLLQEHYSYLTRRMMKEVNQAIWNTEDKKPLT